MYRPLNQNPLSSATIILRASPVRAAALGSSMQRTIAAIDPDVPVEEIQTVNDAGGKGVSVSAFPC